MNITPTTSLHTITFVPEDEMTCNHVSTPDVAKPVERPVPVLCRLSGQKPMTDCTAPHIRQDPQCRDLHSASELSVLQ